MDEKKKVVAQIGGSLILIPAVWLGFETLSHATLLFGLGAISLLAGTILLSWATS